MLSPDKATSLAIAIFNIRRARASVLPSDIFSEPSWDILLALFIADARGQSLTGREISDRADIPTSVTSRWLIYLTKLGLILGDGVGNVDDNLTLSPKAVEAMEHIMLTFLDTRSVVR